MNLQRAMTLPKKLPTRQPAGNLSIDTEDFEYAPFSQEGGIGKAYQLFGEELNETLSELNE